MEEVKKYIRNKGGRPKKAIKKSELIGVRCSPLERKVIKGKAKMANLSTSEYLCTMGVNGKIDRREKTFPKEILQLTGTLNHTAANLNQIAKKRNGVEELNAFDRAKLQVLTGEVIQVVTVIKNYLK